MRFSALVLSQSTHGMPGGKMKCRSTSICCWLLLPASCYVASGAQDAWSDPDAEWLGAREASAAWRLFGHPELPRNAPLAGEPIITEGIGYHRREGGHDLTAWDWMQFLLFLDKNDA